MLWFGSTTALARLANVLSLLVLLRALSSHELGLASLVLGIAMLFESLASLGIEASIVQAKSISEPTYRSLHGFCIVAGLLFVAAIAGVAPLASGYYAEPALRPMLVATSAKLALIGFTVVPLNQLLRNLDFRRYSVVQTAAAMSEDVIKVALALAGAGAWSLVIANAVRGGVLLLMLPLVGARLPWPRWCWREVRAHLSFGARASLSNVATQSTNHVDYFIVGRVLGVEALGIYRVAFELAVTPIDIVARTMYRVAYPVFARLAAVPSDLGETLRHVTRTILLMTGPVAVIVAFGASDLLHLVGGTKWLPAAAGVHVLVWAGLLMAMQRIFKQVFNALGRPELTLYETLASLTLIAAAIGAALRWAPKDSSMLALGLAWSVAYVPLLGGVLWVAKRFGVGGPMLYLRCLLRPAGCVALSLAAGLGAWKLLPSAGPTLYGALQHLAVLVVAVLAAYALALRYFLGLRLRDLGKSA